MDWDRVIHTVAEVARKVFALALAMILIMLAVGGTYVAGLTVWWVIQHAKSALGA